MSNLDLTSTCPDGVVIKTPFPDEWNPQSIIALDKHAARHRDDVRLHLRATEALDRAA